MPFGCEAEVGTVLETLDHRGYTLGLASNYDHRLRSVVAGLPEGAAGRDEVLERLRADER